MREAILYEKLPDRVVICHLCAHRCRIRPGRMGVCAVRENRAGTLYTHVHDRLAAEAVDPIEKKPLFHVLPGSSSYSISAVGCNFHCRYCQTWDLSQTPKVRRRHVVGERATPEEVVARAVESGCESVAYTFAEPTVFLELALEVAHAAREADLLNLFVTNGFLTPQSLDLVAGAMDAVNVDVKGWDPTTHRAAYGAEPGPVLDAIRELKRRGIWVEIVTPIVPGITDDESELAEIAGFLADVDPKMPWHLQPFVPAYLMSDVAPVAGGALEDALRVGRQAGLVHVYAPIHGIDSSATTICAQCGGTLVEREGHAAIRVTIAEGRCPSCGTPPPGIWTRTRAREPIARA